MRNSESTFCALTHEENQALHDELKKILALTDRETRRKQLLALLWNPASPQVMQMRIHSFLADNDENHSAAIWHYLQGLRQCLQVWDSNYKVVITQRKSRKYLTKFGDAMIAGVEKRSALWEEELAERKAKCKELNVEMKAEVLPSYEAEIGVWKKRPGQAWTERWKLRMAMMCK
ncbi:hypothetical protein K490DRAFT_63172 [Saccharata proteae CBS 121410]|uniref:Uncharacterized protein n=1 Tax=Saccharata proteae CBS 121410 TaxID=1314787 RepID=A0A9P4M0L1_9PEZI|nr:hypothetical protein K490DRAFT_63172 [Saccharata proteae CBS 121410]